MTSLVQDCMISCCKLIEKKSLFGSRMGDKADWSDCFLKNLFDACKEEIQAGNRPMGIFTATGWKNVISKFAEKSGDGRTKKQLKNKLDVLKKEYSIFMEFKFLASYLEAYHYGLSCIA